MMLTKVQSRFVNSKSVGFTLLKGKKNTGKTMASIKRAINLENNYCIYPDDKVLYITEERMKLKKYIIKNLKRIIFILYFQLKKKEWNFYLLPK